MKCNLSVVLLTYAVGLLNASDVPRHHHHQKPHVTPIESIQRVQTQSDDQYNLRRALQQNDKPKPESTDKTDTCDLTTTTGAKVNVDIVFVHPDKYYKTADKELLSEINLSNKSTLVDSVVKVLNKWTKLQSKFGVVQYQVTTDDGSTEAPTCLITPGTTDTLFSTNADLIASAPYKNTIAVSTTVTDFQKVRLFKNLILGVNQVKFTDNVDKVINIRIAIVAYQHSSVAATSPVAKPLTKASLAADSCKTVEADEPDVAVTSTILKEHNVNVLGIKGFPAADKEADGLINLKNAESIILTETDTAATLESNIEKSLQKIICNRITEDKAPGTTPGKPDDKDSAYSSTTVTALTTGFTLVLYSLYAH